MTTYLLAGGGTAGHINPLLAVADALTARDPDCTVLALGTREGLEARLVPARGYELLVVPRLPLPRRLDVAALGFLPRMRRAVDAVAELVRRRAVDVVVGFGGYVATPAYLAARRAGVPIAIHEANARPGLANRLGSRMTPHVGVAFAGTRLPHARLVGVPLRREIVELDRPAARALAWDVFGLTPELPTLLVTGGSGGARRINRTMLDSARSVTAAGWQVLHLTGGDVEARDPRVAGYRVVAYSDRMELALSVADAAVSRAGAATVSELNALGIPAVYVPYPVGNGEQRLNPADVVRAGGGLLVDDATFLPGWIRSTLLPVLADPHRLHQMGQAARSVGVLNGTERMIDVIDGAVHPVTFRRGITS